MRSLLRATLLAGSPAPGSPRLAQALDAVAYAKTLLADGYLTPSEFELAVDTALGWLP